MKPCANGATCLDGINRFSCLCPAGFSGRFCTVNVDDCASRPCLNAGRCLDRAGGFRCVCRAGFRGATCETPSGGDGLNLTTEGKTQSGNSSRHGDQLFRVTLSERSTGGLSEGQLTILLVLAGLTLSVVLMTAALVLHRHCKTCGHAPRWSSSSPSSQQGQMSSQRTQHSECRTSFLNAAETEKKKLNTEIL